MVSWEQRGRQVLEQLGVPPNVLRLVRVSESPGGAHLDYQQVQAGMPVFDAGATLHLARDGSLISLDSDIRADVPPPQRLGAPTISKEEAERIAVAHVGGEEVLRGDPTEELGILALPDGRYTLAWRVICPAYRPAGDWLFQINATNGDVLSRENVMVEVDRARVFYPNPIVTSGNLQLYQQVRAGDGYAALVNQTQTVELQGLVSTRDPNVILAGELARIVDTNPPRNQSLPGEDFLFEPNTAPFAAVMAYFWLDTAMRYLRRLGFRDLLSQGVEADPQDRTAKGGAFYSLWARRMGFAPPEPGHPGMAEDAKVILHEFGHAVQHDQVRDWGRHPEAGAMGEGFGDALATIYFAHVNQGFNRVVVGDWVAPPGGIRRVDRDLRYPGDMEGEPHHDGQIWSRALWDLYRLIGGDSPDEETRMEARDIALKLIVQSHYFLRTGARFADGARALLQADQVLYDGKYAPLIRRVMAERGISVAETAALRRSPTEDRYADVARVALQATRRFPWWL